MIDVVFIEDYIIFDKIDSFSFIILNFVGIWFMYRVVVDLFLRLMCLYGFFVSMVRDFIIRLECNVLYFL